MAAFPKGESMATPFRSLAALLILAAPAAAQERTARAAPSDVERRRRIETEIRAAEAMFAGRDQDPAAPARPPGEPPAGGAQEPPRAPESFLLRNTSLQSLVERVAQESGYRYRFTWRGEDGIGHTTIDYMVPERLSPKTPEEWFHLLHKILSSYGYILEPLKQEKPDETVYRIKSAGGAGAAAPGGAGAAAGGGGLGLAAIRAPEWAGPLPERANYFPSFQYVHRYIKLENISTGEALALLKEGLGAQQMGVLTFMEIPAARKLRVHGYDVDIYEVEQLIRLADVRPEAFQFEIIPLRNALATATAPVVESLLKSIASRRPSPTATPTAPIPGARPTPPAADATGQTRTGGVGVSTVSEEIQIAADPRTNSIIVQATDYYMKEARQIIDRIDASSETGTLEVRVYHLKHTVARDVAQVIINIYSGQSQLIQGADERGGVTQGTPTPAAGGRGAGALGGGAGGQVPDLPATFVNDNASNAIIAFADRNKQKEIAKLIEQLDQRRPQVQLECFVVQVTAADSFDLGVELAGLDAPRDGTMEPGGRTNVGLSTIADVDADGVPDIVPADLPGGSFFLFKDRIGQLLANIHANKRVSGVRVIEKPTLVVLDNSAATIRIQTNVPVLQSNVTGVGILTTSFLRFEAAETMLSISPHISEGNYVRLGIDIKVEKFTATVAADATIPPPKTTRQVSTVINVPDRYTVLIGGLITNDTSENTQGVPFLYKIPILGHLFRRDQEETTQTTLNVFVTPTILYDHAWGDFSEETIDAKRDLEEKKLKLDELTPWPPRDPRDFSIFRNAPARKP
jgi:general secretion pathway protein D